MKIKMKITALLLTAALFLTSCQKSTDITGSYTIDGMDSVYTFTADGKIYVNDETEGGSRYEGKGDKIITHIDGVEESVTLPFEKTEDGFRMGEVEYRKLPEREELFNETETDADADAE